MLSISSLIDFLLDLLRDEEAAAEFARDPQAMLARHGLEGVTAQDVCDVEPILADTHGVSARPSHPAADHVSGGGHAQRPEHHRPEHGHDDPVREIHHVTTSYQVDHEVVVEHHTAQNTYNEYNSELNYYDHSVTTGDDSTVVQDSFNEDNDGVDNKGGVINDSNVANGDQDTVGNSEETTVIEDSFDEDDSETTVIVDSGNDSSDNSTTVEGSLNDSSSSATTSVNDSYNIDAPVADAEVSEVDLTQAESAA